MMPITYDAVSQDDRLVSDDIEKKQKCVSALLNFEKQFKISSQPSTLGMGRAERRVHEAFNRKIEAFFKDKKTRDFVSFHAEKLEAIDIEIIEKYGAINSLFTEFVKMRHMLNSLIIDEYISKLSDVFGRQQPSEVVFYFEQDHNREKEKNKARLNFHASIIDSLARFLLVKAWKHYTISLRARLKIEEALGIHAIVKRYCIEGPLRKLSSAYDQSIVTHFNCSSVSRRAFKKLWLGLYVNTQLYTYYNLKGPTETELEDARRADLSSCCTIS